MTIDRTLELTFNHVVLPPELSREQDNKVEDVERELLTRLFCATKTMEPYARDEDLPIQQNIAEILQTCGPINERAA